MEQLNVNLLQHFCQSTTFFNTAETFFYHTAHFNCPIKKHRAYISLHLQVNKDSSNESCWTATTVRKHPYKFS